MQVGIVLPVSPEMGDGGTWAGIAALALQAEAGGADSLWAFDHFLYRWDGRPAEGSHESFTILAAVAAVTRTVSVGPLVAATSFRSPGMLAKIAATLDLVAPGRVILGLGCGWHEPEYRAFGYPFDHRVGRFEEALQVVRPLLDGQHVTLAGQWTATDDAELLPAPGHRVPLVIAAEGPRMLGLAARWADGWQTAWHGLPDDGFRADRDRWLEAHAREGRRTAPAVFAGVTVADGGTRAALPLDADAIADGLRAWAAAGVAHVQLWVRPVTQDALAIALEGIRRSRG